MFPIEAFRVTVERFIGILRSLEIRHHLTGGVGFRGHDLLIRVIHERDDVHEKPDST